MGIVDVILLKRKKLTVACETGNYTNPPAVELNGKGIEFSGINLHCGAQPSHTEAGRPHRRSGCPPDFDSRGSAPGWQARVRAGPVIDRDRAHEPDQGVYQSAGRSCRSRCRKYASVAGQLVG